MRGRSAAAGLLLAAFIVAGCGSEDFPNEPRPPAPIELSAKVDNRKVTVDPDEIGAGLATFTISNQSRDDVQLAFEGPNGARTDQIPGDVRLGGQLAPGWGIHLVDMSIAQGNLISLVQDQWRAYYERHRGH